jgi:hypothetical protein
MRTFDKKREAETLAGFILEISGISNERAKISYENFPVHH